MCLQSFKELKYVLFSQDATTLQIASKNNDMSWNINKKGNHLCE